MLKKRMTPKQRKIFDSVIAAVSQKGWTAGAFAQGLKNSGSSSAEAHKLFPNGILDIIEAFHHSIDSAMLSRIEVKRNFRAMRVRDKITFGVRARLEAAEKNQEAMRRLLVWSLMPSHMTKSSSYLWQAADAIWIAAGDTATDYNRITKRLLLIAVMKSTLSFWLNDVSQDHCETWEFLDRRIADVLAMGKALNAAKSIGLSGIASFARSRFAA